MKDPLYRIVKPYFDRFLSGESKVLIACSGGADSMALTSLVGEYSFKKACDVLVVYVHHGLRSEASVECKKVADLCQALGFSFKERQITGLSPQDKNLEERCREKRYEALKEEYADFDADALLTAHHGNDLIETMLKRLFEGARIDKISSMKHETFFEGMRVLRPLLYCLKEEIASYVERKNISYSIDSMNEDPKYLRARMRTQMLPFLEEVFGKKIEKNLIRFHQKLIAMEEIIAEKTRSINQSIRIKEEMKELPVDGFDHLSRSMQQLTIPFLFSHLNHSECQQLIRCIQKKEGNKTIGNVQIGQSKITWKKEDNF